MSDIQRLKAQLYQLMTEAQQGAGSLGGFRQKFGQTSGPSSRRPNPCR